MDNYRTHFPRPLRTLASGASLRTPAIAVTPKKRVIVVGAGLAGLCAAYELQQMGYAVTVYEARRDVGGRVRSDRTFSRKKTVELGGELIGSNHALWGAYAKHFNLKFTDVKDYGDSPMRVNGRMLSFDDTKALLEEFDAHKDKLNLLAETIVDPFEPWTNPNAAALDRQSLSHWLDRRDHGRTWGGSREKRCVCSSRPTTAYRRVSKVFSACCEEVRERAETWHGPHGDRRR